MFIFMTLVCELALFFVHEHDMKETNYELQQKIETQNYEIEQLKKKQRITSQDVDFIQRLIIEGAENGQ